MTNTVTVYEPEQHNIVVQKNAAIMELRDHMFERGIHYGEPYKGAGKPTLLKPGAETIMSRFQLWPKFIERSTVENWDTEQPIFHYRYECQLIHRVSGEVWGAGIGSCNSMEDKYRWRKQEIVCPNCGAEAVIKGKAEYGGGWLCWGKKGGCGAKWKDGDPAIEDQPQGKVPNTEVFTIVNTIDKMAQKRALVAAVLVATGASAYFTQDVEDFPGYAGEIIDGEWTETARPEPPAPADPPAPPARQPRASKPKPTPPPASELDEHFGPAPDRAPVETSDDDTPFTNAHWKAFMQRLIDAGLCANSFEAFGRLKKLSDCEEDNNNPWPHINEAHWTHGELWAAFEARAAEKAQDA